MVKNAILLRYAKRASRSIEVKRVWGNPPLVGAIHLPPNRASAAIYFSSESKLKDRDKDGSGGGSGIGSPSATEAASPGLLETQRTCSSKHLLLRVAGGDACDRSPVLLFQHRTEGESVLTEVHTHTGARTQAHARTLAH